MFWLPYLIMLSIREWHMTWACSLVLIIPSDISGRTENRIRRLCSIRKHSSVIRSIEWSQGEILYRYLFVRITQADNFI